MFIGREKELSVLEKEFHSDKKTAVLVYGKRRIGKSTLISRAAESFDGIVINYLCTQTSVQGNLDLLTGSVTAALNLPEIHFSHFTDLFSFLNKRNEQILIILDEYQYLKEAGRKGEVDSMMQAIIDHLGDNIKIVLCGSYITIMKELLNEENPLFGRFTSVIHLEELDYYVSSLFYPDLNVSDKISHYSIFGGSPYVNANTCTLSIEEGIKNLLLPETGILRIYVENVILKEIQKQYDVRILQIIGNGKVRYSQIENALNMPSNGLLTKQLKQLIDMETIRKTFPINKPDDKKKQFYEINDNLIRFYFTYIFGKQSILSNLGEEAYYNLYIKPSLNDFISRRFESIVSQYIQREIRKGMITDVYDAGTYWYDDPHTHKNEEFDCVLKKKNGYSFIECKFYSKPMSLSECKKEEQQILSIPDIHAVSIGFACSSGFDFTSDTYHLITGKDLY